MLFPRKDYFSHCEHFLVGYSCLLWAILLSLFILCLGSHVGEALLVKLLVLLGDKSHCKLPNHLELDKEIDSKRYQLRLGFTLCISNCGIFIMASVEKENFFDEEQRLYLYLKKNLWKNTDKNTNNSHL